MSEMRLHHTCLLLSILLPLPSRSHQVPLGTQKSSPFTPSFGKAVAESLDRWHTPGLAISVVDGDETYSKGYGIAEFPDKPITPSTLFYTASTTKSFTAAAVSLLVDDTANTTEALNWQVPLINLMREDFLLPDEYATNHVTIEDALSHRTGMPGHDFSYGAENTTVQHVVQNLRNLPLTAEIRTKWQYCNMMYITISHFIETWTGMWLGDFLKTRIYEPLNMTSTFFSLEDAQAAEAAGGNPLAVPYYWTNYTQSYHSLPWLDGGQESGAGATISNVLDYAKWLRCHMTKSAPISRAGYEALHSPRMISSPLLDDPKDPAGFRGVHLYALGWMVDNYRGETMLWHTGGLPGFTTWMLFFPRLQWGATMIANGGDGSATFELIFKLIDDYLGVREEGRFDWVSFFKLRSLLLLENLKNARDILYPNAPKGDDAIPLSLPIECYAGTYISKGYGPIILTLNASTIISPSTPTLHSSLQFENYPINLSFEHVSGEYFFVYGRTFTNEPRHSPDDFEPSTDATLKVEFRLGEDGQVRDLGMVMTAEMGEEKTWFTKEGATGGDGKGFQPASSTSREPGFSRSVRDMEGSFGLSSLTRKIAVSHFA